MFETGWPLAIPGRADSDRDVPLGSDFSRTQGHFVARKRFQDGSKEDDRRQEATPERRVSDRLGRRDGPKGDGHLTIWTLVSPRDH